MVKSWVGAVVLSLAGSLGAAPIVNASPAAKKYDVAVIGGGAAGIAAALQSAHAGAKTILVERDFQLGGTTTAADVPYPGMSHAWGRQIVDGYAYALVTNAVVLSGFSLPVHRDGETFAELGCRALAVAPGVYAALAEEAVRAVSSDHRANGALRVQMTCMAMGQVAGEAAAFAAKSGCHAHEVDLTRLKQRLSASGAIVPGFSQ